MKHPLLTVSHLSAWYGSEKKVLTDLSLELKEHEVVGLIGLNGAGKTTFLKVISGLLPTFHAEKTWFRGQPMKFRDRAFKLCRYTVFAEDHSFSYFTFREYLAYVFTAYGKSLPDVSGLLRGFHFEDNVDMLLKDLSTGNRKKAFLITGFALKPDLLFLDEPVGALDFQSTEFLYQQIAGYKEFGTILFSSHIPESSAMTSDRVFVLDGGQIRQTLENRRLDAADIREVLHYEYDS